MYILQKINPLKFERVYLDHLLLNLRLRFIRVIVSSQIFERINFTLDIVEEVDRYWLENADEVYQLRGNLHDSVDDLIGNDNDGGRTVIGRHHNICLDSVVLDLCEHVICGLGTAQFVELSRNVADSGVLIGIGVDNDFHILFPSFLI